MTGTNLQGTNVISMIVPTNHADTYATHDSIYGKGGWREVNTIAERDAIPAERRRRGMVVFVRETYKAYMLKTSDYNGGWVPFPATEDVTDIINEAIAEGKIIIDLTAYATKAEVYEKFADYYTSGEVDALVELTANNLKEWVEDKHYLTDHQSLEGYVKKAELSQTLENYVLNTDLIQELQNYVLTTDFETTLSDYAKVEDLENYSTKAELTNAISGVNENITTLSDKVTALENAGFVTEEALEEKGYINADNAEEIITGYGFIDQTTLNNTLTAYETKAELTQTLNNYATTSSVDDKLTAYETKAELTQTLESYPTKTEVQEVLDDGKYITLSDLQGYATELWVQDYLTREHYTTVSDLQGYATELWVQDLVDSIIGGEIDLTTYQKKEDNSLETTSKTIVGAINELNAKPAVDAYTKEESDEKYATNTVVNAVNDRVTNIEEGNVFVPTETYEAKIAEYETKIASLQSDVAYLMQIIATPPYDILPDE